MHDQNESKKNINLDKEEIHKIDGLRTAVKNMIINSQVKNKYGGD